MKKPTAIVLMPRFTNGNFDGYDQVAGTAYLDTEGHLYALVRVEDYNALKDAYDDAAGRAEDAEKELEELRRKLFPPAAIDAVKDAPIDLASADTAPESVVPTPKPEEKKE